MADAAGLPIAGPIEITSESNQVRLRLDTNVDGVLVAKRLPYGMYRVRRLGADLLARRALAIPGRALPDVINTQPGWLLEANGILHPRDPSTRRST